MDGFERYVKIFNDFGSRKFVISKYGDCLICKIILKVLFWYLKIYFEEEIYKIIGIKSML